MADNEPTEPTAAEYREYLELEVKATAGPWHVDLGSVVTSDFEREEGLFEWIANGEYGATDINQPKIDADFIAASRRIGPAAVRRMTHLETMLRSLYSAATETDNDAISPLLCREITSVLGILDH